MEILNTASCISMHCAKQYALIVVLKFKLTLNFGKIWASLFSSFLFSTTPFCCLVANLDPHVYISSVSYPGAETGLEGDEGRGVENFRHCIYFGALLHFYWSKWAN